MRVIRMLRAMWRGLETELRTTLNGHEGGNPGNSQGESYGPPRQPSTLPRSNRKQPDLPPVFATEEPQCELSAKNSSTSSIHTLPPK